MLENKNENLRILQMLCFNEQKDKNKLNYLIKFSKTLNLDCNVCIYKSNCKSERRRFK